MEKSFWLRTRSVLVAKCASFLFLNRIFYLWKIAVTLRTLTFQGRFAHLTVFSLNMKNITYGRLSNIWKDANNMLRVQWISMTRCKLAVSRFFFYEPVIWTDPSMKTHGFGGLFAVTCLNTILKLQLLWLTAEKFDTFLESGLDLFSLIMLNLV